MLFSLRVPLVKQKLLTLPEYPSSPSVFLGVRVALSIAFCVVFCTSLFAFCYLFFCQLYCLTFFGFQLLIIRFWYLQSIHNTISRKVEDFKGVIRNRKTDRQCNGKKQKRRMDKHDLQNITQKTKDRGTRTTLKTEGVRMSSGRISSSCSIWGICRGVALVTHPVIHKSCMRNGLIQLITSRDELFVASAYETRVYHNAASSKPANGKVCSIPFCMVKLCMWLTVDFRFSLCIPFSSTQRTHCKVKVIKLFQRKLLTLHEEHDQPPVFVRSWLFLYLVVRVILIIFCSSYCI